jgi:hypothetical protein
LLLLHGSEDIIASGAGDDAICLFAEEKSSMVHYPSIPHLFFFHDFSPYVLCLAGLLNLYLQKYTVLVIIYSSFTGNEG